MYTILKKRRVKTHKDVIYTGFLFIEEYYDVLLRFCRSRPVIPQYRIATAEEILSDLVVERMPNWILNCRLVSVFKVKELCSVRRIVRANGVDVGELSETELSKLHDQMQQDLCRLIDKKQLLTQGQTDAGAIIAIKEEMNAAHERYLELTSFIDLKRTEKKLLGYIYECIRRIKIKYLQTTKQTLAAKKTLDGFSLDIELAEDLRQVNTLHNGSSNYSNNRYGSSAMAQTFAAVSTKESIAYGQTSELFEERVDVLQKLLMQLPVSQEAVNVFLDLAVRSYTYGEVCREYGLSRSNAGRMYQSVAVATQNKFTETELVKLLQDM